MLLFKNCLEATCKIFQVFVLIALILFIASFFIKMGKSIIWMAIFIAFYLIYIIIEFCSPMCKYLCRKTNNSGLKQLLGDLFNLAPVFKWMLSLWNTYRTKTVTKKVVTHRETVHFAYKSCKDISGKLVLNYDRKQEFGKAYVKLDLNNSINFDFNDTQSNYNLFKKNFYNRNRKRDAHMDFNESKSLHGFQNSAFICIRDIEPCGVNACLFVLFTLIPIVDISILFLLTNLLP